MDAGAEVIWKALERQKGTKDVIERGTSAVQQFYQDCNVLVTGGTGFLGKQLVEKLFRSCKLNKVFIMLRAKKGKTVEERLAEVLKDPIFDTLREYQPGFETRIVPVVGEMAEKNLGISEEDRRLLVKEVDVIFHVAATISFQEPLRSATLVNVRGTRELLALAKECKKLRTFMYVSTAYSHATFSRRDTEVLEQFYPSPMPPALLIRMAETMDEERLNLLKDGLITDWPNTYSFTKALAEELVRSSAGDFPICIIRPSIVICARREPYAGWIDLSSVFGPSGITLGCMLGVIHSLQSVQDIRIDFVPVDYVNNLAIAAATAAEKNIVIYNVGSSKRNPITWGGLTYILNNTARKSIISPSAIWYCFVIQSPYRWVYQLFSFLLHTAPAFLADGICVLLNKPPRLKKTYATITKMATTTAFYTNNNWIFNDNNTVALYNNLSETDKVIFNFDITNVEWTEQICLWCAGLRKYIVKDGMKNTAWGMKKQFYYRIAHYTLSVSFCLLLFYLLRVIFLFVFM
ncbi:hypothetical protein PYW08_010830 [Mythimna loreyi]|uniref:Uncharacterized protein n=1 Tax=Mythimna loreyi TaxID=667449 RepID=A0ACC2Q2W1_9NEOP|nr:hypothetical protein PYW08_010830 [Mythimna loreyi]